MSSFANASKHAVVVDTGVFVAAIDRRDGHHEWARSVLPQLPVRARTCEAVAAEALHLLGNAPAAIEAMAGFLGRMDLPAVLREELKAVFDELRRFAPEMDLADACVVALADRDPEALILTTDTRDFSKYRRPFASPVGLFASF